MTSLQTMLEIFWTKLKRLKNMRNETELEKLRNEVTELGKKIRN